jgi:ATP-dependent Clp protease adaptor protein ClpS
LSITGEKMGRDSSADNHALKETETKIQSPPMYQVLIHNDDYTTMDFVVHILETIFGKSPIEASRIMFSVHNKGVGVCGIYDFELAETKIAAVHAIAEQYEFPLRCSMEEI